MTKPEDWKRVEHLLLRWALDAVTKEESVILDADHDEDYIVLLTVNWNSVGIYKLARTALEQRQTFSPVLMPSRPATQASFYKTRAGQIWEWSTADESWRKLP